MEKSYRRNAGIVVFNKDKKVLMCARVDKRSLEWQFPQGGIDEGETPLDAAYRELKEETSIISVKPIYTLRKPIRYSFPRSLRETFAKIGRFNYGQDQFWTLFYFTGEDSEINLNTETPEFKTYAWMDISEAPKKIVFFKRAAYKRMVSIFEPIIAEFKI